MYVGAHGPGGSPLMIALWSPMTRTCNSRYAYTSQARLAIRYLLPSPYYYSDGYPPSPPLPPNALLYAGDYRDEYRILTHFYSYLYWDDPHEEHLYKRSLASPAPFFLLPFLLLPFLLLPFLLLPFPSTPMFPISSPFFYLLLLLSFSL
jgi:hypothetical protein